MKLVIAHLYPRDMNIYGDMGNIITLVRRLEWRGYEVEVRAVDVGEAFDFTKVDIVFGGGGQDSGQLIVGADLIGRASALHDAAANGTPMLMICGLYQLFGRGFTTIEGQEIPGLGIFHARTVGSQVRMIGNITLDTAYGELVGFENHSGQTLLEADQAPLGKVIRGYGNDERSGYEGAVTGSVIGTYLHGPVLPKNPALADHLIGAALNRRGVSELAPLDDTLERAAAATARRRPQ